MKFLTLLLLITSLASCAKDAKYDKEKAVSAFVKSNESLLDPALQKVDVVIPEQKKNDLWNASISGESFEIENFHKDFRIKKEQIYLKKRSKLWSFYAGDGRKKWIFAPIIKNGKAYVLDSSGTLRARDLELKKTLWKKRLFPRKLFKKYQNPKISSFDKTIFAIVGLNRVVAVNEDDGEIIWSKEIASIPISTPISDGKLVYLSTNDNKLYAFDIEDGRLDWVQSGISRSTAILGVADLVTYKDYIIASYSSGEMYVLKKSDGEPVWSRNLNLGRATNSDFYLNDIDATPIVRDDIIYAIGNGGLMMAVRIADGKIMWKKPISGIINFWLAGEFLFVIDGDNKLLAIHNKTGGVKWISQLPDYRQSDKPQTKILYTGVVMAGDKLLVSRASGKLLIISPLNGEIEKTFSLGKRVSHSPVIVNNKIYFYILGKFITDLIEIE